jgi:hypothetical protein
MRLSVCTAQNGNALFCAYRDGSCASEHFSNYWITLKLPFTAPDLVSSPVECHAEIILSISDVLTLMRLCYSLLWSPMLALCYTAWILYCHAVDISIELLG